MALPDFNEAGDLPEGLHRATLDEVLARFGEGTARRKAVTGRLLLIHALAFGAIAEPERMVIFGSYVTDKAEPNDVDIVLVMRDDFNVDACPEPARKLFDHAQAESAFGASVFWIRPSMLILETLDEFISYWQLKRDGTRRGIVEVTA